MTVPRGIRARLGLAFFAVVATILAATFGVLHWRLRAQLAAFVDTEMEDEARELAQFIGAGDVRNFNEVEATMRASRGPQDTSEVSVLRDAAGAVVAGYAPAEPAFDLAAAAALPLGAHRFATVRVPWRGGRFREVVLACTGHDGRRYYVQSFESLAAVKEASESFARGLFLAAVAGSAIAAAGGLLLVRVAFRPFAALVEDARAISPEDLARRLRDPGTGDELAHLTGVLNALLARVEAGVASVRRFVHDASHELRTPLASLRLGAEATLRRADVPDEVRELMMGDLEEVERLARLVDDLLALARAEGELPRTRTAAVDVAEVVRFVGERARPLAEAAEVELAVDAAETGPLTADRDALVRVLWNVVDNAIRHTPARGRVRLASARGASPGEVRLVVEDTGEGIAAEDLPHVFDRFNRRAPGSARPAGSGLGLGLAIARALARQHGGDVAIASERGKGTTVTVVLRSGTA